MGCWGKQAVGVSRRVVCKWAVGVSRRVVCKWTVGISRRVVCKWAVGISRRVVCKWAVGFTTAFSPVDRSVVERCLNLTLIWLETTMLMKMEERWFTRERRTR